LVVASDVGIVNELVVDGQNGKLTKPRDVEALTEALVNGIRNVDYYNLFGVKARETIISKFSMNKIGVTLTKIYSKILEDMPK
jgi:glycosyltransferase involved in cell wall biosynthesis